MVCNGAETDGQSSTLYTFQKCNMKCENILVDDSYLKHYLMRLAVNLLEKRRLMQYILN